jgi:protein TonB
VLLSVVLHGVAFAALVAIPLTATRAEVRAGTITVVPPAPLAPIAAVVAPPREEVVVPELPDPVPVTHAEPLDDPELLEPSWEPEPLRRDAFLARRAAPPPVPTEASFPEPVVEPAPVYVEPLLLDGPRPDYPRASVRRGEEGRVLVRLGLDASGAVVSASVVTSSGHPRLDRAALEAVRRWSFHPAFEAGVAVPSELVHAVVFRLDGRA